MAKHDTPVCSMCAKRKRTIHRGEWIWRICSKCDQGLEVRSDDDDATPPEAAASV